MTTLNPGGFLIHPGGYRSLVCYKKSVILYDMTIYYIDKYLQSSDRTYGQMQQAARSGKQNIVEGSADGVTSMEMEIKLMNVARSSIKELREDYEDYLKARHLPIWGTEHPRYDKLVRFCRNHNKIEDYQPFFDRWNDEEMANTALTLCHQTDAMLNRALQRLEKEFVEQGGIKERMHAARTGYRQAQDTELVNLRQEVARLRVLLESNGIKY